jgi:hypothetical protein
VYTGMFERVFARIHPHKNAVDVHRVAA